MVEKNCPDENLLAALAEGRLLEEERARLEDHLLECEDCRMLAGVVAEVADDQGLIAPAAVVPTRSFPGMRIAAAIVLMATIGAIALLSGKKSPSGTTEDRLVASFRSLGMDHPDLFADGGALSRKERLEPSTTTTRGGMTRLSPTGTILETRPVLAWQPEVGVAEYEVGLSLADMTPVWTARTSANRLVYPAEEESLAPGRYVWEVSCNGPLGPEEGRWIFEVATPALATDWERIQELVAKGVAADLRPLALAHAAIRKKLFVEAEREARSFVTANPEDTVGRETLFHILSRVGTGEAEEYRPEETE